MKITIVNHSDSLGGASVVSRRLMHAMRALGHDATMLVAHKSTADHNVTEYTPQWRVRKTFLAEHLRIFLSNGLSRSDLFKASVATDGLPLAEHPSVENADAVILNWVNQGMLSLDEIKKIATEKTVLWTMHDMWNLTGICHHAGTCLGYRHSCGHCPLLHFMAGKNDLSHKTFLRKKDFYESLPNIRLVAVSSWLRDKASESGLTAGRHIDVVPNAFPLEDFHIAPRYTIKGIPCDKKIILMGAARLDDPVKGLGFAVEILNKLKADNDAVAVFFGAIRDPKILDTIKFPHIHYGMVNDADTLRELYAHASVVISTSLYETLPGTLIEGQSAGCTPVAFDSGGQRDIIDHGRTGYLVPPYDTDIFAEFLSQALEKPFDKDVLRASVSTRFSAQAVAAQYIKIIEECVR